VRHVISAIQTNQIMKLTICRRVNLSGIDLDLPSSLQLAATSEDCRGKHSFYWRDSRLEFVGTSPEVTVQCAKDGTTFISRAAGSWPSDGTSTGSDADSDVIIGDRRVITEHALAVKALRDAVQRKFQTIHRERGPEIVRCLGVNHLISTMQISVGSRSALACLLELVFPSGAIPYPDSLRLLCEIGEPARGPYYGMIGFSAPDGQSCWAHVLRSVFRTRRETFAWTGAAVTGLSTPKIEYEETRWKLRGVLAGRLVDGREDCDDHNPSN
jgi:isochorismate synthase EntC